MSRHRWTSADLARLSGPGRRVVEGPTYPPNACDRGCGRPAVRQVHVLGGPPPAPGCSANVCELDDCSPEDRPPRPQTREHDPLAGATQLERRYAAWLEQEQAAERVVAWRG